VSFHEIYERHADIYDRLVSAEDSGGHLLPAIEAIAPLREKQVLEVGVGTGRVTRLMLRAGARVRGFDRAEAMLAVALGSLGNDPNCTLAIADAEQLPVDDAWADVAIAAWVFGHFRHWMPENWRSSIGRALGEMQRALKPGGTLIVIETLGTGSETPNAPSEELAEYYSWLEHEHGLSRTSIRTDYRFESAEQAHELVSAFFGPEKAERTRAFGADIPECTGLWWRQLRRAGD
jgi:ubiquinone/menaquinone biosynthesis C-methylase UbiE